MDFDHFLRLAHLREVTRIEIKEDLPMPSVPANENESNRLTVVLRKTGRFESLDIANVNWGAFDETPPLRHYGL